jgi:hypothetical protein
LIQTIGQLQFQDGDLAVKAVAETVTLTVDWMADLAAAGSPAPGIGVSTWRVTAVRPHTDADLELADEDLTGDATITSVSLSGGLLGSTYLIVNTVTTNESPAEVWTATLRLLIE